MNYADNRQVLCIALCYFLFGIVCMGIYTVLAAMLNAFKRAVNIPSVIKEDTRQRSLRLLTQNVKKRLVGNDENVLQGEIFNFLFILTLGIFMVLFNYVLLDGEFRIYTVASFFAGLFVSVKAFSKFIRVFVCNLLVFVYTSVLMFLRPVFITISCLQGKQNKTNE